MAQAGATLQNYNNDLVRCTLPHPAAQCVAIHLLCSRTAVPTLTASGPSGIEELREKREDLNRSVAQDEEEKGAPAMGPGGEA
eukprot:scaffold5781_cov124-Isochrysis_galbana.AAC.5